MLILLVGRDWFDYTRDIVTMVGYLATVGTFLYLFRRDNDKQKQIDSLANLALFEEEKLRLSVMPDLYRNGAMTRPDVCEIAVDLLNRGENAYLISFESSSVDVTLHSFYLPEVLEKDNERKIFLRSNEKNPNDCEYIITVKYGDKLKNVYELDISGHGSRVSFGEARLIKSWHKA